MKILSSTQIKEADYYTITHEPISSIDLMERAASKCAEWVLDHFHQHDEFVVLCGPGNNGGDGLVIARLLHKVNKKVLVHVLNVNQKFSDEFIFNLNRYKTECSSAVHELTENYFQVKNISSKAIIIDAFFGSGLSKPITGWIKELIIQINKLNNIKIAIDIPSGLGCDDTNFAIQFPESIMVCNHTITFQTYKLSLLLTEGICYAGNVHVIDIDLHADYLNKATTSFFSINKSVVQPLLRNRSLTGHKGTFGYALLICGSTGKAGAAALSAKSCMRSGCGLLTVLTSPDCVAAINSNVPEAMTLLYNTSEGNFNLQIPAKVTSIGIGCGLSVNKTTASLIKQLLNNYKHPLIIDASALTILSENKTWLSFLQPKRILTPHPGEFDRLFNLKNPTGYQRLCVQQEMSKKLNVYIVLKNYRTSISTPKGLIFFNTTGNNGMATAGSGDVLTGLLTGLLAQGYSPLETCLTGVYIHGLAGDFSLEKETSETLIASDLINNFSNAFKALYI